MQKAVLPGTFDPPTNGHLNLVERGSRIFDELHVVIAVNIQKKCLFSAEERVEMLEKSSADLKNVYIHTWDSLIVDFARKIGAFVMLRGVRAFADFGYEFELSVTNRELFPEVETLFLPTDPKYFVLRSSGIKEIAMAGGDVSAMVPKSVHEALKEKYRTKTGQ
jgi:pantetheine-phosphate adenylyltransferase